MPTNDLNALYDLAAQLLDSDDATPETLDALERTAERVDQLRASAANDTPPVATPLTVPRPAESQPRPKPTLGPRITTGADRRPLYGGEAALPATIAEELKRAFGTREGYGVIATLHATEDRPRLGRDPEANTAIVAAARTALTAAGGVCGPVPVRWEQRTVSSIRRPVREALPGLLAARGGVQLSLPPGFHEGDAETGVGVWTHANDVNPGSNGPAVKPVVLVPCPENYQTVMVNAITQSMRVGTFALRWEFERTQAWVNTLTAQHAALAEETLLAAIVAGSKAINHGQVLGTATDVLTALDQVCSMFRNRHRMEPTDVLQVIAPSYVLDMMRADLARRVPGDSTLAVKDAEITAFFKVRNVEVVWSLDYQRIDNTQGPGPAIGWPSTIDVLIFAKGSWMALDGGEFDVGWVRDLDLVRTNEAVLFAETFEHAVFVGGPNESLRVRLDVCSNGGYASALDIAPCVTGS